jgi:diacylglycerol kinase (ATP)
MPGSEDFSFSKLMKAADYSLQGLKAAWQNERAFRQEVVLLVLIIPIALWLADGATHRVLLIGSWLLVIVVELVNSAIEAIVDRISDERHELAGRAKDLGSAAVFVSILLALLTWILVLLEIYQ